MQKEEQERGKVPCDPGHQKGFDAEPAFQVQCTLLLAPGKMLPSRPGSPLYFVFLRPSHYLVVKALIIYRGDFADCSALILRAGSHRNRTLQELICILPLNSGFCCLSPDFTQLVSHLPPNTALASLFPGPFKMKRNQLLWVLSKTATRACTGEWKGQEDENQRLVSICASATCQQNDISTSQMFFSWFCLYGVWE